jgi:hypothetical protein
MKSRITGGGELAHSMPGEEQIVVHTRAREVMAAVDLPEFGEKMAGVVASPSEPDHQLVWLRPDEARDRHAHAGQSWTVGQFLTASGSG